MATLINIDNGGTQTDICVIRDDEVYHGKALTTPYDLSERFVPEGKTPADQVQGVIMPNPKDVRIAELGAEMARLRGE